MNMKPNFTALLAMLPIGSMASGATLAEETRPVNKKPRNVVFIISDDHRYDFMGFLHTVPWLHTPVLDRMAAEGAYLKNAFVTTSLSSPSRASVLTGLFSHEHGVVDNQAPLNDGLTFFPEYLQQAGYTTGFFGKWHMGGDSGEPQPGFDHWEGFRGQGTYYNVRLNVNGKWEQYESDIYATNLLTDHAIDFISKNKDHPFFVYLSHKSVHDPFQAAESERGMYRDEQMPYPQSFLTPRYGIPDLPSRGEKKGGREWYGEARMPDWVKNQRESWHGVDYAYHGRTTFENECRKYCETLTSLDKSIGKLIDYLHEQKLEDDTLIIYMGDNGFLWGEHGLIDKRNFYEASVRIPMLAYCPGTIPAGTVVDEMVQNIDIAPTIMAACGIEKAPQMRGVSFLPMLEGESPENWRDRIYYEYYWEYDYPQTPTTFGVRTDRYKYIRYHGIWDTNEFYDLEADPCEMNNLIDSPEHQGLIRILSNDLYDWLEKTDGMAIPLKRTVKFRDGDHRNKRVY